MKKKTIQIPIYNVKLTVFFDKDLSYIEKTYRTVSLSNYGAITMKSPFNFYHYIVAFTHVEEGIIAHEVVHLVNYIFKDKGLKLDVDNDEAQAYLTGWLYDKIKQIINKIK
jgi:hypothetical protein